MKKLSLLLSLCCSFLLIETIQAAVTNNTTTPQGYFLTEPSPAANSQYQPSAATVPTATQATPLRSPTSVQLYNPSNLQAPGYASPTYTSPTYGTSGTSLTSPSYGNSSLNTFYPNQQIYSGSYSQSPYQGQANTMGQDYNAAQPACPQSYEGYRYIGQGLASSSACCDEEAPEDQPCGDNYCLYCHYRPCYYYTTECDYVPQYEYQRCCRYVPQYYNETRCKQVPQYYKVMQCKMVKEPYCVTRCCNVQCYNSETCCCETVPQYYQETCCREVPQYYEQTCCRQVPQYYEETCCRYVPQYYYTCQCKYCPQYKYKRQCKYIPQYYYKHETNCNQGGMQGPQCCLAA